MSPISFFVAGVPKPGGSKRAASSVGIPEIWKPVVGFEIYYEVSNHGRLRRRLGGKGTRAGRLLRCHRNTSGYPSAVLFVEGRKTYARVHSLVAAAFIGGRPSKLDVNHKNGIRHDNHADNLEYITRRENLVHSRLVLGYSNCGERHGQSKLTQAQVDEIRAAKNPPRGWQSRKARELGVNNATIRAIRNGATWRADALGRSFGR